MQIERIGIAGFGAMGSGIAQVVAGAGFSVTAWDRDETSLELGKSALDDSTDKAMDSGTLGEEEKKNILASMTFSTNMADLKESDLIIESVSEDLELKKRLFSDLSAEVKEEAILATSTSCFSVTEISQSAKNPQSI
jgi:3-hydroxybutyryl-CoA dehydrogenase